jgi:hypothetical protein
MYIHTTVKIFESVKRCVNITQWELNIIYQGRDKDEVIIFYKLRKTKQHLNNKFYELITMEKIN